MDGALVFFPQCAGMVRRDAGDEHDLSVVQQFAGDFDHLFGRLARTKDDFREIFSQRAVRVHLGETEVGHRGGLESAQHFFARDFSRAKLVE